MFSKLKPHLFNKARDKNLKNHSERSRTNRKIFWVILLSVLIFGIGQIKIAHAGIFGLLGIDEIAANAISAVAQGVGFIFGFIGGIFITIAGYLVVLALNINFALFESPVVQTGWKAVLNFTNLGFILAIIVIAFATIFRLQSYAMKQTLWKLIVAALLVNFSLVIAGAFINVSDNLSNFFIKQGEITSPGEWASAFMGMFRAQALLKVNELNSSGGIIDTSTAAANTFGGAALQNIASIFFVVMFTILACLTLLAAAIMLLIRYVYLGILLILSPIVWLLWIFPSTQHLWQKWWNNFLRWTFFAPIMLFFISLSRFAMENQPEAVRQFTREAANAVSVRLNFGVDVIGEMIIVIGLVMGGLIAANSLGITFAKVAYGAAQGATKGFGLWASRLGPAAGAGLLRRTGIGQRISQGVNNRIQQWQQQHPGQALPRRLRLLQNIGITTQRATAYKAPSFVSSVFGGMKSGSGLFKGKKAAEWACRHCGYVVKSARRPTYICPSCANPVPDWEKLATS
jgi:hypothetical protein